MFVRCHFRIQRYFEFEMMENSRFTPLSCLPMKVEEDVAKLLQLQSIWKEVAGSLGIRYIDINVCGTSSLMIVIALNSQSFYSFVFTGFL